jgi:hypothetical protein
MKSLLLSALFVLLLFCTCKQDEVNIPLCENCAFSCLEDNATEVVTNDCRDNWDCTFRLAPQSRVATGEFEGLASGEKLAFQLLNSTQGDERIADDEFTYILVFELEDSLTSFSAEGEELSLLQVHFRRICFCPETDFRAITAGCLQGEKQSDGSWFVQGNLNVPYTGGDFPFKLEAQFVE